MTVLVHEFVTGGGLSGRDLPRSWAAEGAAMRGAIARDFAAIPGARVVATVDRRVPWGSPPGGVEARVLDDPDPRAVAGLAAGFDYTLVVAPESGGILLGLVRALEGSGRSIGCRSGAVELAGDKAGLARRFEALGIPTPPTRAFEAGGPIPRDWPGPTVVKPVDGAGSLDTYVIDEGRASPPGIEAGRGMVAQPRLAGSPMSASFVVDLEGRAWPVAVGRQRVEVDAEGRVAYLGGEVPATTGVDVAGLARAVDAVPGLLGFVGVDFLDHGGPVGTVLEVNPRPTTSYVGLVQLLPPGTIAGAWLAAASGGLAGTEWPGRLRDMQKQVMFDVL